MILGDVIEEYVVGLAPVRDPRCKICGLPLDVPGRERLLRQLLLGYVTGVPKRQLYRGTLATQRTWPAGDGGPRFSWWSCLRHLHHLDVRLQAERRRIEAQAAIEGVDLEAAPGWHVSGSAAVRSILARGAEMIATGQLRITASEYLRAAAIDLELRPREELLRENQRNLASLSLIVALIQELVDPDVQRLIYERFSAFKRSGGMANGMVQPQKVVEGREVG